MSEGVAKKILKAHLVEGELNPGKEIGITIDQTLTQDATGTMAYLEFERMEVNRVRTRLSVSYIDHNMLQQGFENADDHRYLQSVAAKYGLFFSRPGNGICHQVHVERFARPGETLLGSDSHTPTSGGVGMIAIGAGGLEVALAMAGRPYFFPMPKIVLVRLNGKLRPWVTAKDVILEMLRRLTVKGGTGRIFEYGGEGVKRLSVPERTTIANMGAELGATTSIFPSDEITKEYLRKQGRVKDWQRFEADRDAEYDEVIEIDLGELEPLIACPHSPDNVKKVKEIEGIKVQQVCIGSCTNSSYKDLMTVASILRGKKVHPGVSLSINPGSRQVLEMISRNGALADLVSAGARILENACGPCIGMGQAPPSDGVSVRTFNRNFEGRSGTKNAKVYLASPEVAAACAISGEIVDPRRLGKPIKVKEPKKYLVNDKMLIPPSRRPEKVEIIRGPNIRPIPEREKLADTLDGRVILKLGDNISTDHILPAGTKVLPLRSNIPAISEWTFSAVDPEFVKRAREWGGGFIIGGQNYGQGSSREHAAIAPMYLGVKAVIAKSIARIHRANLINFGIIPLILKDEKDYELFEVGDELRMSNARKALLSEGVLEIENLTKDKIIMVNNDLTKREKHILLAGGMLNFIREGG